MTEHNSMPFMDKAKTRHFFHYVCDTINDASKASTVAVF
jgi:hypothetical protein